MERRSRLHRPIEEHVLKLPGNKTKIVCTIGPASESPDVMKRMIEAGRRVRIFEVDKFMPWGTPEELKTFLYWNDVFRGGRALP